MRATLEGDIAVISPHLDDAAFSLGAAIAHATAAGSSVRVVTVLAGDWGDAGAAGAWDRSSGFETAGEASAARAAEDDDACRILGATPVRLRYFDKQYERGGDDGEIVAAVRNAIGSCDVLLLPGFPLAHEDHLWLTRLLLDDELPAKRVGVYVEQPYAARMRAAPAAMVTREQQWITLQAGPMEQIAKFRACRAYRSQIEPLGGLRVLLAVLKYEGDRGGESIGWLGE